MKSKAHILIIDDDHDFATDLALLLKSQYRVSLAYSGSEGLQANQRLEPDLVLLDLMLGETDGIEILKKLLIENGQLPVIMITDYASIETAVEAIQTGAVEYISKMPHRDELLVTIEKALLQHSLLLESQALQRESARRFAKMVGVSAALNEVKNRISLSAENRFPVLITGESGTGKELVARQIHMRSPRKGKPFITLNCAAIPRELAESELFGHERGSFTGATQRKAGLFEIAHEGVLFLDEIGELDLDIQVKLLRVLQEGEFSRVGSNSTRVTNARILAATNMDLLQAVEKGTFREDLFYRLDVLQVNVPPLRERKEDIPLLVEHFLQLACLDMKVPLKTISQKALEVLIQYSWPGNIRELRNVLMRAVVLSETSQIDAADLEVSFPSISGNKRISDPLELNLESFYQERQQAAERARRQVEASFVKQLLAKFNDNVSLAARELKMNRTSLHKMISRTKARG